MSWPVDGTRAALITALETAGLRVVPSRFEPIVPPCVVIVRHDSAPDQGPAAVRWELFAVPVVQVGETPAGHQLSDLVVTTVAAIDTALGGSWREGGPDDVANVDAWGYTVEVVLLAPIVI